MIEKSTARKDLIVLTILSVVVWLAAARIDLFETIASWAAKHEEWQVDELFALALILTAALALFSTRRWRESRLALAGRSQAVAAMMESEERYRQITENSLTGIFIHQDGVGVYVNQRLAVMLGYTKEEMIGRPFLEAVHPADREMVSERAQACLNSEPAPKSYELRLLKKSGEEILCEVLTTLIEYQGRPALMGNIAGITDGGRAEQLIRQAELRYRRLFEDAPLMYVITRNEEGAPFIIDCNDMFLHSVAHTREEVIGQPLAKFYSPSSGADLLDGGGYERALTGEFFIGERQLLRQDRTIIPALLYTAPETDPSGEVIGTCAMFVDVTDQKRAEEALLRSETQLSNALIMAKLGHWEYDVAKDLFTFNDHFYKVFRTTVARVGGYTMSSADYTRRFVHPDDIPIVGEEIRNAMETTDPDFSGRLEHRILYGDGEVGYISVRYFPVKDARGRTVATCGVNQDITERKKAEEQIEKQASLMESLLEAIPAPVFYKDANHVYTGCNEAFARFMGLPKEEIIGKSVFDAAPRELAEIYREQDEALFEKPGIQIYESSAETVDGSIRHVIFHKAPYTDASGAVAGLVGVILDITERKRAEADLSVSKERYRTLFENAPVGIFQTDSQGATRFVNPHMAKMVAAESPEAAAAHFTQLPHQLYADPQRREDFIRILREEGEITDFEYEALRIDGSRGWFSMNARVSETLDDGTFLIEGFTFDVTDRKQTAEALRESEAKYRTLIEASPDGVFVQVGDKIQFANSAMSRMVGAESPEALQGTRALDLVHPDYHEAISQRMIDNIEHGEPAPLLEQKLVRLDGSVFDAEAAGAPISYRGKRARQVLVRDITERKTMQKQLLEAQKMEAVGTLAGGVAHDFNNLLHIISGHAELLEMELSERRLNFEELNAIRQAAHRGADLVKQILTFSRRIDSKFESINLNEDVKSTERLLYRTIPKMIEIELALEEGLARVRADSTQIEQMLINLAVNAQDAMPDGGKLIIDTRNVLLDGEYCRNHADLVPGRYVLLTVSDTGHGIEPDVLQHIFEPFFTTKGLADGTGLGLATVFGIVKMHGGHINCESEIGKGTTFRIYFPAAEPAWPDADVEKKTAGIAGGTETILVVDDEPMIRELAKRILEKSGYSVLSAGSGREGIDVYAKHKSDISLVILDLIMPEMGGKQCLEELLKINPRVKALIASGFAVKGDTKMFLDTEAKGIVPKPFNMRELLRAVRHVLDGSDSLGNGR